MSRVDDRDLVERQIGRRPRAFRRVAARCPFGAARPSPSRSRTTTTGAPFPTTYYLTCRHLVAAVSRLEAAGGVERWSAAVAASPELTRRSRATRPPSSGASGARSPAGGRAPIDGASLDSGIGGSRNPAQLKCLHAHVAFALAQPGYRLGELDPRRGPRAVAADRCCSAAGGAA